MARVTNDYAFGYDETGETVEPSEGIAVYGNLVVISDEGKFQFFVNNPSYDSILLWAGPSDDPAGETFGYFIAYTSATSRSTPVEEVESNVGFLRASARYGLDGENDFVAFVNSRFGQSTTTGNEAQQYLVANGMWSNFGLNYDE
jgi:hypothetical protein